MIKIAGNTIRKIADFLKAIIEEELKVMDAFYQQSV